jgi:hypothetical protein
MIIHNEGGSVTLLDDKDIRRKQEIAAGYDPADLAAAIDAFFGPTPVVRRLVPKSVVQERVNALGKLGQVFDMLRSAGHEIYYARWFAPDWPNVYADDEGLLDILNAVGCTPDEINTITA